MNEVYKEESARSAINNASNVAIKEIDKLYAEIRFLRSRNDELESYKANNGGQGEYWQFMEKNEKRRSIYVFTRKRIHRFHRRT